MSELHYYDHHKRMIRKRRRKNWVRRNRSSTHHYLFLCVGIISALLCHQLTSLILRYHTRPPGLPGHLYPYERTGLGETQSSDSNLALSKHIIGLAVRMRGNNFFFHSSSQKGHISSVYLFITDVGNGVEVNAEVMEWAERGWKEKRICSGVLIMEKCTVYTRKAWWL